MKQTSPHIEDKLLDFAYGELPNGEAQAVEAHLQGCAACAGAFESIQGVRRVMSRLPVETAPDAGLESLLGYAQQAARRVSAGPAPAPTWWRRWVAPLGGLAALVVVGVVYTQVKRSPSMEIEKMAAPQMVVNDVPSGAAVVEQAPRAQAEQTKGGIGTEMDREAAPKTAAKALASHHAGPPAQYFQDRREPSDDANQLDSKQRGGRLELSPGRAAGDAFAKEDQSGADKAEEKAASGYRKLAEEQEGANVVSGGGLGSSAGGALGGVVAKAPVPVLKNAESKKSKLARRDESPTGEAYADGAAAEVPAPAPEPASPPALAANISPVESSTVARAQPRAVATAAAPPVYKDNNKQEESLPDRRSRQADEAHRSHDYVREIQYLKEALAAVGNGPERRGLLVRLCDAETQVHEYEACERVRVEDTSRQKMERAQKTQDLLDAPSKAAEEPAPTEKKARRETAPAASTTSQ